MDRGLHGKRRALGLAIVAGETLLGIALLTGGRWAKLGWTGVIAFHLALMLFGWGFWLWCVPALLLLIPLAKADWPRLDNGQVTSDAAPSSPTG